MTLRLPDNLGTSFDNETDDGVNVLETPEWVSDLFSNSTLIDSNAHMELKGFCKNVVHYSIPVLGIRYLDTIALIHNIIFLFYLFWKWGVLGRQLRRGKSAVFTAFMLLVYFCIFANTANVVYNVTVTVAKVRLNEFYETIIWSCTKFIHLVIEYSVIFFSFLFGRLDSAKCVVHAFLWSVVIAGLQTGLQYAFQTELIDDEWILQFIDLDGNIGFTIASFLMMIGMYLFVALVHVSCCGKSIDLPRPFYFAWFCILMISVNVVQAVGAAMVLLNLQEGYCFSNASVMFYSCYYAPLVFSTFLKNCYKRPRNNESNGAFMYRKQKDEIGELRDSYFPRFSGLTSPSYDDLFDYGRDARYTHYDLATGEYLPNPYSIPLIMSSAETAESTVTTRTGSDEMVANRDSVLFEGTSVRQLKGLGPQGSLIFEEPRHSWYYQ